MVAKELGFVNVLRSSIVFTALAVVTSALAVVGASPASAFNPCNGDKPPAQCFVPPPPPIPTNQAITGIAPAFGTAGDTVTISGRKLTNVTSVTFAGTPAAFKIVSAYQLTTVVPARFAWQLANGTQLSVALTGGGMTMTTTYSISPTITAVNDVYFKGQDAGNRSHTSVALARDNGFVSGATTVDNDNLTSLQMDVSVIFGDANGKLIGYTPPFSITAGACLPIACGTEANNGGLYGSEQVGYFSAGASYMYPNPGLASQVHSIAIVQVRDDPDLTNDLGSYLNLGLTLISIGQLLALVP